MCSSTGEVLCEGILYTVKYNRNMTVISFLHSVPDTHLEGGVHSLNKLNCEEKKLQNDIENQKEKNIKNIM